MKQMIIQQLIVTLFMVAGHSGVALLNGHFKNPFLHYSSALIAMAYSGYLFILVFRLVRFFP